MDNMMQRLPTFVVDLGEIMVFAKYPAHFSQEIEYSWLYRHEALDQLRGPYKSIADAVNEFIKIKQGVSQDFIGNIIYTDFRNKRKIAKI